MKIGIDGRALLGSRTGVGRYVYELCREIDLLLPSAQFYVYSPLPLELPVISDRWTLRLDDSIFAKWLKPVLWLKFRCGYLCKQDNLNVFWGAATFLPDLSLAVRTVVTIYDLNFVIAPKTMSFTHRWAFKLFFVKNLARANIVLAISMGTSERLLKIFGRRADVIVCPSVNPSFVRQREDVIKSVMKKYSLDRPYLLAVATWEPRKNLELLILTFLEMKNQGHLNSYKLVLVGGRGWKDQRLSALSRKTDQIISLGFVPEECLPAIYTGADIFIFPSIYEGFGMPVAEALACGTTTITSDTPELREVGGNDAIYIEPTLEGIRRGILDGLGQPLKHNFIAQATHSWEDGARSMVTAFTELIGTQIKS
ncbi:Glycosyltransferase involved in cell wall bisynthesis [Polynucleobacter meluiroseus]|uniref:Glycosyltransferase involved in cell wall bisynthesis n=1 Tax=Polynucleobacter meluiroseus TaxID=1938814 RepID=A0A240E101_9BURK|nr:glycosyltransferase family 1 protein [Polynucleobacter meluiroseus]SNX29118.1 Glycosyltransferase involved in cell wall bisynthesis [Polynucleobacter meluiroseus]